MFTAGGARARIPGLVVCLLAAGLGADVLGGCSNSGSYTLQWRFADVFVSGDCGRVGVSGIQITAKKTDGSVGDQRAVPCALGFYDGSLDPGSWTFDLTGLDASGRPKDPTNAALFGQTAADSPVEIHTGEHAAPIPPVLLTPLPQCQDGVDNDLDGRVDLDDPDCAGNPDSPTECGATDAQPCNYHPPGVAQPDGGA